ncbi:MAG: DUF4625 domain-containing protein [Labilibaculum sp.]|nr:DUF4625 domain-containing protein [Labilibaculum sp.]
MKILKYAFIVLFTVGMMSCGSSGGDDTDKEAPGVTITAPSANQVFAPDDIISASFTATDNEALKSYVVSVDFFETVSMAVKITPVKFAFDKSGTLSGKSQTVPFDMELPTNAQEGKYKMTVTVTDASTEINEKTVERIFEIKRE